MSNEATLLKAVLADAIVLGTRLSDLNYSGGIHNPEAAAVRAGLDQLRSSTATFLEAAALGSITTDDIFPLHDEIQRGAARRRTP